MSKSIEYIPVAQPSISDLEKRYLVECLESGWISSTGSFLDKFQTQFGEFTNCRFALATNNGTTALHLACKALGLSENDEVIVPNITFVASANAITYCGAKPIFVDVLPGTLNMDTSLLHEKISKRTKGIIAVHLYGVPCDMKTIMEFARERGLWVIEDAAEALGASIDGKIVGSIGDIATFSFYGNKILTTGEGGMLVTNREDLYLKAKLFRGQGMDPNRRYWFPVVGFNYRMTNIAAALGLAQLSRINEFEEKREMIFDTYRKYLSNFPEYFDFVPDLPSSVKVSNWIFTLYLKTFLREHRDYVMNFLEERCIESRPVFPPIGDLPPYLNNHDYPVSRDWSYRGISLPTFVDMTDEQVIRICETLILAIRSI